MSTFYNLKQRIVDWLAQNFKRDEGIDLLKDKQALHRLTETAESKDGAVISDSDQYKVCDNFYAFFL